MGILENVGYWVCTDLSSATPILLAGLGLVMMNRAGIVCIGAEGIMLITALTAVIGSHLTQTIWLGLLLAMCVGFFMGFIYAAMTVTLRVNQIIMGVAFNILGSGVSSTVFQMVFGASTNVTKVSSFNPIFIPGLSEIPVVGEAFFSLSPLVYVAFALVPILSYFLFKTQPGLNLRSVGENPMAADTLGVNVIRTRYFACLAGCVLIAMGGTYVSTGTLSFFADEMVSGRGYIALATVIFGKYKPRGVMLAAMLFMAGDVLANALKAEGGMVHYTFLMMIPYVLTIVMLAFSGKTEVLAALGEPYKKG